MGNIMRVVSNTVQHATTSVPKKEGLEDVHVVYTGDNSGDNRALFSPSFLWHSDVSSSDSQSIH